MNNTNNLFAEADEPTAETMGGNAETPKAEKPKNQPILIDKSEFVKIAEALNVKTDEASIFVHDILVRKLTEYVKNDVEKYGGLLVTEAELLNYALKFNAGEKAKISEISALVPKIALKKKPPKTEAQLAKEREREAAKAKREAEKKAKEEMLEKWRKCQLSFELNY